MEFPRKITGLNGTIRWVGESGLSYDTSEEAFSDDKRMDLEVLQENLELKEKSQLAVFIDSTIASVIATISPIIDFIIVSFFIVLGLIGLYAVYLVLASLPISIAVIIGAAIIGFCVLVAANR